MNENLLYNKKEEHTSHNSIPRRDVLFYNLDACTRFLYNLDACKMTKIVIIRIAIILSVE